MTEITDDWGGEETPRPRRKRAAAAAATAGAAATDAADAGAAKARKLAAEADARLRASLETIRVKAEDLRRQSTEWAAVRGDQARELIDERPLAVVAGAFGLGLLIGLAVNRR